MLKTVTQWLAPAIAATALLGAPVQAQDWPTKPIRLLVGSPPGAPSDTVARTMAEQLGSSLGQPLLVENRPGAGLNLAAGLVASAEPDGHTFLVTSGTVMTVNPIIYSSLTFDARKDLMPVSVMASFTQMLACNADRGFKTMDDLLTAAKKGDLTYASGGAGVPGHLAAEMFLMEAGVDMIHVPYRGPAPATVDVVGGQVDCGFLATPQILPHVKSGKLIALAVSSAEGSTMAPEVPPAAQAGVPGMDATFYLYMMAPTGTPQAIIDKMQQAVEASVLTEASKQRLAALDMVGIASTPAEAAAKLEKDGARWAEVVQRVGLKVD